jgi:ATP-binding cassette subfamily A (ABC1) protein 3
MDHITASFSSKQLSSVRKVARPSDIPSQCPQNFNGLSQCFAAIAFNDIPAHGSAAKPVNYTLRADSGLGHIDVFKHTSDYELRILPLQWAVDQVRRMPMLNRHLMLYKLTGDH